MNSFQKKNYIEYYTPKYEKGSYHDRFQVDKPLDISSYRKNTYTESTDNEKDYPSPLSARLPRFKAK